MNKNIKICTKCGEIKKITMFYKDKRTNSGLYSDCKECHLKDCMEYVVNNLTEDGRKDYETIYSFLKCL